MATLRLANGDYPPECIVLDHPEWHRGVLGILASRVVERTGRPALIMTSPQKTVSPTARAAPSTASTCSTPSPTSTWPRRKGLSSPASAVTRTPSASRFPSNRLPDLRSRLRTHSRAELRPHMLAPRIVCDLELTREDLTLNLLRWLERCAPFGMGAPEPILLIRQLPLSAPPRIIKEKHICLPLGRTVDGIPLSAMGWSRPGQTAWAARIAPMGLSVGDLPRPRLPAPRETLTRSTAASNSSMLDMDLAASV